MNTRLILRTALVSVVVLLSCSAVYGQKKSKKIDVAQALSGYFTLATDEAATPDTKGFIRRWLLLEPISKPNRTNTVFTDSYIRDAFANEPYEGMFTTLPKDGQKVKVTVEKQAPVNLTAGRPSPSLKRLRSHGTPSTASCSTSNFSASPQVLTRSATAPSSRLTP